MAEDHLGVTGRHSQLLKERRCGVPEVVHRGFDFWVMRDPWDNEFCVLQTEFPELLARREPWHD